MFKRIVIIFLFACFINLIPITPSTKRVFAQNTDVFQEINTSVDKYNGIKLIKNDIKLKSILKQQYKAYEYIIKNNTNYEIKISNIILTEDKKTENHIKQIEEAALKKSKPSIPANIERDGLGMSLTYGGIIYPFVAMKEFFTGDIKEGFGALVASTFAMPFTAILAPINLIAEALNAIFYPASYATYKLYTEKRIKNEAQQFNYSFEFPISLKSSEDYRFMVLIPNRFFYQYKIKIHIKDEEKAKLFVVEEP